MDGKAEIIRKVTGRVGKDVDVAFDCHWAFSPDSAVRLASEVEDCNVWWLEDPIPPENLDSQAKVTSETKTPIAAGENVYRKFGHRKLIEDQSVDILSLDMSKSGGMRETSKIAELADMYYMPVTFHNVCSPVGTMAAIQTAATLSNTLSVEFHSYKLSWWEDMIEESIIGQGDIKVPEKPGLGVTLNLDAIEPYLAEGETLFDEG